MKNDSISVTIEREFKMQGRSFKLWMGETKTVFSDAEQGVHSDMRKQMTKQINEDLEFAADYIINGDEEEE